MEDKRRWTRTGTHFLSCLLFFFLSCVLVFCLACFFFPPSIPADYQVAVDIAGTIGAGVPLRVYVRKGSSHTALDKLVVDEAQRDTYSQVAR